MITEFWVPGIPQSKGSTRAFDVKGRAHTTSANDKTKPWQQLVSLFASQFWKGAPPTDSAVQIWLTFHFIRPKSVSAKRRPHHTVKPDLDKLVRTIYDALTGIVYVDDSQVVFCKESKIYSDRTGVEIIIETG